MSAPAAFSDIGKASNDLLSKDYPFGVSKLQVKTVASNGVNFTVNGTQDLKSGSTTAELKTTYIDFKNGLTLTETWNTQNVVNVQAELENKIASGFKIDLNSSFQLSSGKKTALVALHFKRPNIHHRLNVDLLKGPSFTTDVVLGRDGVLLGGQLSYDLLEGRINNYHAAVGYGNHDYTVALHANHTLSTFTGSYYHRVRPELEVGGKATWESKAPNAPVDIEVGTKYFLDRDTFVNAKVNNKGNVGLGYTQVVRPGVRVTLASMFDSTRLNENVHKLGLSLALES